MTRQLNYKSENLTAGMGELFDACRRVMEAFQNPENGFTEHELITAEAERERDFEIIVDHLTSFAILRLEKSIELRDIGGGVYGENIFKSAALDILTPFFARRQSDRLFELVHVIFNFFKKTPDPDPLDLWLYLRGAVAILHSNRNREEKRFNSPDFVKTANSLDSYVRKNPRYVKRKSFIIDSFIELNSSKARLPAKNDLLSLCGKVSPIPDNIPSAVEKIFDLLAESAEFKSKVERRELVSVVHEIIKRRKFSPQTEANTPFDSYIRRELARISLEVFSEFKENYKWRKDFSKSDMDALMEAAKDYLMDLGQKEQSSLHQYLNPHIGYCSSREFVEKYKGSFQNLINKLEESWREKARCIPGLFYHIKGEFYERGK